MKLIKQEAEVFFHSISPFSKNGIIVDNEKKFLEFCGRLAYKSFKNIIEDSASKFIQKLSHLGHHPVLEHCSASVLFTTNRAIANELVRHRICSFTQESTRYINATSKDKYSGELHVVAPLNLTQEQFEVWAQAILVVEKVY
jgi:thymidylate synthase (FAD)